MNNPIKNWSYEKPTEPGLYLAMRGDVEVEANTFMLHLFEKGGQLFNAMCSDDPPIAEWVDSFKFARLCIGAEARG